MKTTIEKTSDLPNLPGAYALVMDLLAPLALPNGERLAPGLYVYAGSARGPGGIRARCGRHVKSAKSVRWHIDRLTNAAGVRAVAAFPDGTECAIADHLIADHGAETPVPGFGSSDCRHCLSHLLKLPAAFDVTGAADLIATACGGSESVIWRCPPTPG
ncbi:DUF123 domain-containing protein [Magnetospira sp. QH-2]|uniref:GIY-YIG nuclease family protein n=1 Tax=Magnetospira sp. (strain QH-2) TaxID=1288970 RepID=UPI0003E8105A|nr:GIY-YIG nuclease family protein [Magnetospira sp. QH-2]CCQ75003.1 conserved protein of unknown function [Magnetospira sp. QH-2]